MTTTINPSRQALTTMLGKVFNYEDADTLDQVSGILLGDVDPESVEATERWVRQCFNRPREDDMQAHALNALLDGHGVESQTLDEVRYQHEADANGEPVEDVQEIDVEFEYVNVGEMYGATLIFYQGQVYATDCGTFIENVEHQVTEHALSGGDFDDFDIDETRLPGAHVAKLIAEAPAPEEPEGEAPAMDQPQGMSF